MAIENNQSVSMTYELKVEGNVIDGNIGGEALEFVYGSGMIIPGLEARIADMNEGENRDIVVPAVEAYGEYNENAMDKVPQDQFGGLELQVGMPLQGQNEAGEMMHARVVSIEPDGVVLDFNHPLAGAELHFSITINSIK